MTKNKTWNVAIVGGGPAGLSAGVYAANAGLSTVIVEDDGSILKRNAHLENYLGFPAGVNPRLFLEMGRDQADRAGVEFVHGKVETVEEKSRVFTLHTKEETIEAENIIATSWKDISYLEPLNVETFEEGSKEFISVDEGGRTNVEGVYGAGRIAHERHQTIINAGHGADVALSLVEDVDPDYYHDWTVPDGYFTNRGREVPDGCEEIPDEERFEREEESVKVMQEYFDEPLRDETVTHPSLRDDG